MWRSLRADAGSGMGLLLGLLCRDCESTMTDTVEASKRYHLEKYGDVKVLSLSRWIDSASAEGVIESHIVVKFDIRPDSPNPTDTAIRTVKAEEFLEMVQSENTPD